MDNKLTTPPEDYRVTLKNIYRLITQNDYPIFSDGIFSRSQKKGLTLISFWNMQLLFRWRNTPTGQKIWRVEGSKNRYHSELCNRKEHFPLYREYLKEILDGLTPEEFFAELQLMEHFLQARAYNHAVLNRKLSAFISLARENDPYFSREIADLYKQVLLSSHSDLPERASFYDSYVLSGLTLCAIAGPKANNASFIDLLTGRDYAPDTLLHTLLLKDNASRTHTEKFFTGPDCEILRESLPVEFFYGRERDIYELEDAFAGQRKVLLNGTGGIGKTELLRQFLRRLRVHALVESIAAVQYEGNLVDSFARCFRNLQGLQAETRFHESLYLLRKASPQKTILLIDNVDQLADSTEIWEQISDLPCCVIVTSRIKEIPGFKCVAYELHSPAAEAASLIFRRNYRKILTEGEKQQLDQLIEDHHFYHPLTLSVLGKAAGNNHWSMSELLHQCETSDMHNVYHQLFADSRFSNLETSLLRLFAILPYQQYTAADFRCFSSMATVEKTLERMSRAGWLEKDGKSFSMHPMISESIRVVYPAENEFQAYWDHALSLLQTDFVNTVTSDPMHERMAFCTMNAILKIHGSITDSLAWLLGISLFTLENNMSVVSQTVQSVYSFVYSHADEEVLSVRTNLLLVYLKINAEFIISEQADSIYRKYQDTDLWNDPLFIRFTECYCYALVNCGRIDEAAVIIDQFKQYHPSAMLPYKYLFTLTFGAVNTGDYTKGLEYAEEGIRQLHASYDHPGPAVLADLIDFHTLSGEAWLFKGNLEKAREELRLIQDLTTAISHENGAYLLYEDLKGEIAAANNQFEEAADAYLKVVHLSEIYFGTSSEMYMGVCAKLGNLYGQMGSAFFSEAIHYYQEALRISDAFYPDGPTAQIILNNFAVAYLNNNEPDNAIPLLEKAYERAANMAPVAKAEPAWNLSRVWRAKGDQNSLSF